MPGNPASPGEDESPKPKAQPDAAAEISRGPDSDLERHLRTRLPVDRERAARMGAEPGRPGGAPVLDDMTMTEDLEPD